MQARTSLQRYSRLGTRQGTALRDCWARAGEGEALADRWPSWHLFLRLLYLEARDSPREAKTPQSEGLDPSPFLKMMPACNPRPAPTHTASVRNKTRSRAWSHAVCESRRTLVCITHAAGRGTAQHPRAEQPLQLCHILSCTCTEAVRADPMVMKENSRPEAALTRARQARDTKRRPAEAERP